MNGAELRAWRTSRGLYQRDVVKLLADAGVDGIDQPTVSEWERGKEPVPDTVPGLLDASGLEPVQEATPAPRPRKAAPASSTRRPDVDDEAAALVAEAALADETMREAAASDGERGEEQPADDRPPRAVPPTAPAAAAAKPTAGWSSGVRSQLEKDLRTLFAGDTFLVPVPVEQPDGSVTYEHTEAFSPGIAQLVGYMDPFDGHVIAMNAPQMAHAWAQLADENPTVRRLLMMLTYGGAWRGVVAATLPVVYSIGVHHGLIPPVLGGAAAAPPPRVPDAVPS